MNRLPKRVRSLMFGGSVSLVLALMFLTISGKPSWNSSWGMGIVVLVAVFWWLFRKNHGSCESPTCMHVVERLSLEQGRTLHLVEVDGQRLLLASHQSGIGLISAFDEKRGDGSDGKGDTVQ